MHNVHLEILPSLKVTSFLNLNALKMNFRKRDEANSYAFIVAILMYTQFCARHDITYGVIAFGGFNQIQRTTGKVAKKVMRTQHSKDFMNINNRYGDLDIVGYDNSNFLVV